MTNCDKQAGCNYIIVPPVEHWAVMNVLRSDYGLVWRINTFELWFEGILRAILPYCPLQSTTVENWNLARAAHALPMRPK